MTAPLTIPLATQADVEDVRAELSTLISNAGGAPGPAGTPGTQWLTGVGTPSSGLGSDGWYYLTTDTFQLYKKASGAWSLLTTLVGPPGSIGTQGAAGTAGTSFIVGTGPPTSQTGTDGWSYFDKFNRIFYGPKAGGVWPTGVDLGGSSTTQSGGTGSGLSTAEKLLMWAAADAYQLTTPHYNTTYPDVIDTSGVLWPDGSTGTYTTTGIDTTWGQTASYSVSHDLSGSLVTQPTVTRDGNGNLSNLPPLQLSGAAAGGVFTTDFQVAF